MATTKKTTAKSKSNKVVSKTPATRRKVELTGNYTPISNNIYHDGSSYRVRASIGGTKYSQNFSSKKAAYAYRKVLLSGN